jgi:hypothetical protein
VPQSDLNFLLDILPITPYISATMKKALHTAKVVCKVLMFNALCISIFCLLVPILVFFRLVGALCSIIESCYSALKEENLKLKDELYPQPRKREIKLPSYDPNTVKFN